MIYFLSDAHLGSRAIERRWVQQKKVIDMLTRMQRDADAIYLLGDTFDFWFEYYRRDKSKSEYEPFIRKLHHLTKHGIHVHFFTGNHDMWTFGGLEDMTGVLVHRQPYEVERYGKYLYLAHGDGLLPSDAMARYPKEIQRKLKRFLRLRRLFANPVAQWCFRLLPPAWGNKFGYEWARRSRMKDLANPVGYKGENEEELVLFAKEMEQKGKHHDFYIFGHRHIELDLQITADSRVIILGDCFRNFTYARLDRHGNLTLENFE